MRFNPGEGLNFSFKGEMFNLGILVHRFLLRIEQGYPNNPYHSRVHAADVLRMFHVVLTRGGVLSALMASSRARAAVSPPHDSRATPQHEHGGQQVRDPMALSLPFSTDM